MTAPALTTSQKRHLQLLSNAEATESEAAASAYTLSVIAGGLGVNPNVLTNLERLGLTGSRVKRLGRGHQMTVYWLTEAGLMALEESGKSGLASAHSGAAA